MVQRIQAAAKRVLHRPGKGCAAGGRRVKDLGAGIFLFREIVLVDADENRVFRILNQLNSVFEIGDLFSEIVSAPGLCSEISVSRVIRV